MRRAGKLVLILTAVLAGLILLFWLFTSGRYVEADTDARTRYASPVP